MTGEPNARRRPPAPRPGGTTALPPPPAIARRPRAANAPRPRGTEEGSG